MLQICKDLESLDVESLGIEDVMLLNEYLETVSKAVKKRIPELAEKVIAKKMDEGDPDWNGKSVEIDGFMITQSETPNVFLSQLKLKRKSIYDRLLGECLDAFGLTAKGKKAVLIKTRSQWIEDVGEEELSITAPELRKVLSKRIGLDASEVEAIIEDCVLSSDVKYTVTRKAKAGTPKEA